MAFANTLFIGVENAMLVLPPRLVAETTTICFGDQCGDYCMWLLVDGSVGEIQPTDKASDKSQTIQLLG